jgi:hypothetical protein
MAFFFLAAFLGLIPAVIAHNKNRNFFCWWIYGALLLIVALPHAILLVDSDHIKKCPFCAESIKNEAKVCRYCGRELPLEDVHEKMSVLR